MTLEGALPNRKEKVLKGGKRKLLVKNATFLKGTGRGLLGGLSH